MTPESNNPKVDEYAARILDTATRAGRFLKPDEVLCALMSAALSYAARIAPEPEIIGLLRTTAQRMEELAAPRGPSN